MTSSETVALVPTGTGFFHVTSGAQDLGAVNVTGGGWQNAMDLDFTAEASIDFNTGPSTSWTTNAGFTFTVEHTSVLGNTDMQIVNGTGLTIFTSGFSQYGNIQNGNGTTKNVSLLWLPLSQLNINALDYSTQFRLRLNIPNQTLNGNTFNGNGSGLFFGIDNNPTNNSSPSNWFTIVGYRSGSSATQPTLTSQVGVDTWSSQLSTGGPINIPGFTSYNTTGNTTPNNSTFRVDIPGLIPGSWSTTGLTTYYGGAYSGGYPAETPWSTCSLGAPGSGQSPGPYIGWVNPNTTSGGVSASIGSTLGVVLGAQNISATLGNDNITISRLTIDYKL